MDELGQQQIRACVFDAYGTLKSHVKTMATIQSLIVIITVDDGSGYHRNSVFWDRPGNGPIS